MCPPFPNHKHPEVSPALGVSAATARDVDDAAGVATGVTAGVASQFSALWSAESKYKVNGTGSLSSSVEGLSEPLFEGLGPGQVHKYRLTCLFPPSIG